MANLRIDIASEFTGKPAFAKAEAATSSLEKQVDKLGKKLAGAFSAYKVAQFAKESVKAFAADQKAAAVLAKTLENVNQGYATDMVENYIHKTEALYGVLDDKLRPAFAQLVVATGDATKSQALLQTALDVSAGTGKDLESVTAALSKAYLGNTTALQRLGVGLSKADLQGKSFNQVIEILNQNFAGQAANAADTYQGKIDRLNVAFENMKETIGKGLIDALNQLNSDAGFNGVITKMGDLAQYIADVSVGLGVVAGKLQTLFKPLSGVVGSTALKTLFSPFTPLLDALASLGKKAGVSSSQPSVVTNFLSDMKKIAAATAKVNDNTKKVLTTSKVLTKEQKDQLALKKASLELDKASNMFNLDRIEIEAAMQNKSLTENEKARLTLKKDLLDLTDAINSGNAELATKLAAQVNKDYERLGLLQQQDAEIARIKALIDSMQPKSLIDLGNLSSAIAMLQSINAMTFGGYISANAATAFQNAVPNTGMTSAYETLLPPIVPDQAINDLLASQGLPTIDLGNTNAPVVNVTVTGNADKLVDIIMDTTQQQSANGVSTRIIRNTGGLNW